MIGNDIIDLGCARQESNWQRRGFMDKLFTDSEQTIIHHAVDSEKIVWLLWSMKESAYKIIARQEQRSFYAPKKFCCSIQGSIENEEQLTGTVSYQNDIVITKSLIHSAYIHTLAWTSVNQVQHQSTINLTCSHHEYQRQYTYEKTLEDFARLHQLEKQHLSIRKNEQGIPQIVHQGKIMPQHISISHHGIFGGFVF